MRPVNKIQILVGIIGLLLGSLIYLVDRPPDQIYFIYTSALPISLYNTLPNLFGSIGNSLPAFIHVFSFILITAGLAACRKRGYLIICLFWFAVDSAFELGQHFTTLSLRFIPDWFAGIPYLENTENYFLRGTFDFHDLAAITLGIAAAYAMLLITTERRQRA